MVRQLTTLHPGIVVVERDLAASPVSHLSGRYLAGQSADVKHDQAMQEELDLGGTVMDEFLAADIVVTATGLRMQVMSGMTLSVDGQAVKPGETMSYKGMMYSGIPNLATVFGYTNASWTLKADLTCEYVCRLLGYMDARGYVEARPVKDASVAEAPFLDFSSGYVQRALAELPRQGTKAPWKLHQNYALDLIMLRYGKMDDGTLMFRGRQQVAKAA